MVVPVGITALCHRFSAATDRRSGMAMGLAFPSTGTSIQPWKSPGSYSKHTKGKWQNAEQIGIGSCFSRTSRRSLNRSSELLFSGVYPSVLSTTCVPEATSALPPYISMKTRR
ncbi:hypothetical protein LXL04_038340 [Taraxacum kok-saghyz]